MLGKQPTPQESEAVPVHNSHRQAPVRRNGARVSDASTPVAPPYGAPVRDAMAAVGIEVSFTVTLFAVALLFFLSRESTGVTIGLVFLAVGLIFLLPTIRNARTDGRWANCARIGRHGRIRAAGRVGHA